MTFVITLCEDAKAAADASMRATREAWATLRDPQALAHRLPHLIDDGLRVTAQLRQGVLRNGRCLVAGRAGHGVLCLHAGDAYRELVAAIACEGGFEVTEVHGWPILSLVNRNSNVAEAGGRCTRVALPGGGQSAKGRRDAVLREYLIVSGEW